MIEITDKTECCGCAACTNVCPQNCIEMRMDCEGFFYPKVDMKKCVKCGCCEKVCPIIKHVQKTKNYVQRAVIVQHKDEEICRQSTAGGAFTAIAQYVIERGGVVFGVEMQPDYSIRHIAVEKIEDLFKFRNSKYVQSSVGNTYQQVKEYLLQGRMVCYSGTPCQIEGLRHFLHREYEKLILVDVVCRAVPSPGVWKKYISMETDKRGKMQSIRFRDKTLGYQYSTMEMKDSNGKIYRGGIESQPWLRMFFSGMIIRPSCTECKFRSQYRNSDFTIWDCFNVYSIDKKFDEDAGTTRVLIHTSKAEQVFTDIKNNLKYKNISVDVAVNGVQELVVSPKFNERREEFFKDYETLEMEALIKKYFPETAKVKFKKYVRLLLNRFGMDKRLKHILKKG